MRRWIIGGLVVFGLISGQCHEHQRQQEQQRLEQSGYVDTGKQVDADQCAKDGGTMSSSGDFCLVP